MDDSIIIYLIWIETGQYSFQKVKLASKRLEMDAKCTVWFPWNETNSFFSIGPQEPTRLPDLNQN
jgi:hypothetical protein